MTTTTVHGRPQRRMTLKAPAKFMAALFAGTCALSWTPSSASTPPAPASTLWMGATVSQVLPRDGSALEHIVRQQTGAAPVVQSARVADLAPTPAPLEPAPEPRARTPQSPIAEPAPETRAARAAGAEAPDVFGSVALAAASTGLQARWRHAASARAPRSSDWAEAVGRARSAGPRERLAEVNAWVNRAIRFESDATAYGRSDYWAPAAESLALGRGDCEDYAIAKMQLLRAAGVPASQLYLVVVKDLIRRQDHAVLAVRQGGRFWILDNGTDLVLASDQVEGYRPVVTYSAERTWVHGFSSAPDVQLAASGALAPAGRAPEPAKTERF